MSSCGSRVLRGRKRLLDSTVYIVGAGDLRRVDLVLPPPSRLDAGAAEGALPRATQHALGKLLAACGLDADFAGAHIEIEDLTGLVLIAPLGASLVQDLFLLSRLTLIQNQELYTCLQCVTDHRCIAHI